MYKIGKFHSEAAQISLHPLFYGCEVHRVAIRSMVGEVSDGRGGSLSTWAYALAANASVRMRRNDPAGTAMGDSSV